MSADASLHATTLFRFDNSYARELEGLYERWRAERAPAPLLLALQGYSYSYSGPPQTPF